jgi:formylglycine-generating enzyme required for sulfatase activity
MTERNYRYPGVRPFETKEQHLFFGRNRDIGDLYDLILLERLTVLFGKSGYGKSSLLKAGIIPRFTEPGVPESHQYQPVEIRLGTYIPGKSATPLETVVKALEGIPLEPDVEYVKDMTPDLRLWHHFKIRQAPDSIGRFFLIFDQFEEFFSYPDAEQAQFRAEIAELLYEEIPQDVRLAARSGIREQRVFLATPFDAKVLFSIRADRLSLLDGMKDRLPAILHKRYELLALDEDQARESIVTPAALSVSGEWKSAPFQYSKDALEKMLTELSGKHENSNGRIEAFQLQIVCTSIEKRVIELGLNTVTATDLPDFDTIYEDYYKNRIGELLPGEQEPARLVLEDGLLLVDAQTGDARRLSRDSIELAQSFGVSPELLKNLERTYLIRRELNTLGGYNYEISHDTLIAPMLKSRKAREETLEQKRLEQERLEALSRAKEAEVKAQEETARRVEAERLQEAAEKAKRRANIFAIGAIVLAGIAGIALGFANKQRNIARRENSRAQQEAQKAEREKMKADSSAAFARLQEMEADTQKNIAVAKAEEARLALDRMEIANDKLVEQTLSEAQADILALNYEAALSKVNNVIGLGRKKAQIANILLEIAYFFNETGRHPAQKELTTVAALLNKKVLIPKSGDKKTLRALIQNLLPIRFSELEARYYPVMRAVRGGSFQMVEDGSKPARQITLSEYQLAKTATTVWQYNLMNTAKGFDFFDEAIYHKPARGWRGSNPMVFVSWYDAVLYANWLSEWRGLTPAYEIKRETDPNNFSDIDQMKWTVKRQKSADGFRLPTESEWICAEFLTKETTRRLQFYDPSDPSIELNGMLSSPLNRYDWILGWEWCWDWYADEPSTDLAENPEGPSFGRYRVLRGKEIGRRSPDSRTEQCGFRLAQGRE